MDQTDKYKDTSILLSSIIHVSSVKYHIEETPCGPWGIVDHNDTYKQI